jgi:4-methyl-5(b-hydroxyethyl)-thiazole monophosphate biosynthesis
MEGKIYEFLADGFDEIEALVPVDAFRRAGLSIETVSISGNKVVQAAHHVNIEADKLFEEVGFDDAVLLILPGGVSGAENLMQHEALGKLLKEYASEQKLIGAICAGPSVLGELDILDGRKATVAPGWEQHLKGADYTKEAVTVDGNITTADGAGSVYPFTFMLMERLIGKDKTVEMERKMMYLHE